MEGGTVGHNFERDPQGPTQGPSLPGLNVIFSSRVSEEKI